MSQSTDSWTDDDGASCDDGLFCTVSDQCHTGVCSGTARNCADGVGCTVDSCNETTDSCDNTPANGVCDNGQYCDGAETCDPVNDCQAGNAPDCSDGVGCTVDSCNEDTDSLRQRPDGRALRQRRLLRRLGDLRMQ